MIKFIPYEGMILTPSDITFIQQYILDEILIKYSSLINLPGILYGLEVTPTFIPNTITINPGAAFDIEGNYIALYSPYTINFSNNEGTTYYVKIEYKSKYEGAQYHPITGQGPDINNPSIPYYTRLFSDIPIITIDNILPTNNQVLLAEIYGNGNILTATNINTLVAPRVYIKPNYLSNFKHSDLKEIGVNSHNLIDYKLTKLYRFLGLQEPEETDIQDNDLNEPTENSILEMISNTQDHCHNPLTDNFRRIHHDDLLPGANQKFLNLGETDPEDPDRLKDPNDTWSDMHHPLLHYHAENVDYEQLPFNKRNIKINLGPAIKKYNIYNTSIDEELDPPSQGTPVLEAINVRGELTSLHLWSDVRSLNKVSGGTMNVEEDASKVNIRVPLNIVNKYNFNNDNININTSNININSNNLDLKINDLTIETENNLNIKSDNIIIESNIKNVSNSIEIESLSTTLKTPITIEGSLNFNLKKGYSINYNDVEKEIETSITPSKITTNQINSNYIYSKEGYIENLYGTIKVFQSNIKTFFGTENPSQMQITIEFDDEFNSIPNIFISPYKTISYEILQVTTKSFTIKLDILTKFSWLAIGA